MTNLVCNYATKDFNELIKTYLDDNKVTDFTHADLNGVFYTDGGSRVAGNINYGGWGVHGYLYIDKPTNGNCGCKKAVPTKHGYHVGKITEEQDKAFVVAYVDYYGTIHDNSTNNIAELRGMLKCLHLIKQLKLNNCVIHADSEYVLGTIQHKEKYKNNDYQTSSKKPLANQELCKCLIEMYDEVIENTNLELRWVKGHSGDVGNDAADSNATKGCFIAANKIQNIIIKTDSNVVDDYKLGNDYFNIGTPDTYFDIIGDAVDSVVEAQAPAMLSENSLFFSTNGIDTRDGSTYYQASFGKSLSGKDKEERKKLRGKPFSDCCISVTRLFVPDPVINNIINIVADNFPSTGVIECNLAYQTRKSVYSDLINGGLNSVRVDLNKQCITLHNNEEIASLANPVRQTFKLINDFNEVKEFLDRFIKHDGYEIDSITDITELLYNKKEGKNKTTYNVLPLTEGVIDVPILVKYNDGCKTTTIPVTIGVDTPSRLSLGRMKNIQPKISLVTWETDLRTLRFATLIESTEGIGVWMGIYSNVHLH